MHIKLLLLMKYTTEMKHTSNHTLTTKRRTMKVGNFVVKITITHPVIMKEHFGCTVITIYIAHCNHRIVVLAPLSKYLNVSECMR